MNATRTSTGTARRKLTPRSSTERDAAGSRKKFAPAVFEALAEDLQSGRVPLDRVTVSDDQVPGLRCIVRNTGLISYHVQYDVDGSRPYLRLGDANEMTVEEARSLARTVRGLADKGIDVQAGLHSRLVKELKRDGVKWKP